MENGVASIALLPISWIRWGFASEMLRGRQKQKMNICLGLRRAIQLNSVSMASNLSGDYHYLLPNVEHCQTHRHTDRISVHSSFHIVATILRRERQEKTQCHVTRERIVEWRRRSVVVAIVQSRPSYSNKQVSTWCCSAHADCRETKISHFDETMHFDFGSLVRRSICLGDDNNDNDRVFFLSPIVHRRRTCYSRYHVKCVHLLLKWNQMERRRRRKKSAIVCGCVCVDCWCCCCSIVEPLAFYTTRTKQTQYNST